MDFIPRDFKPDAPQAAESPITSTKTYYFLFNLKKKKKIYFLFFFFTSLTFAQAWFSAHAWTKARPPAQPWQIPCHFHVPLSQAQIAAPKTSMPPLALLLPRDLVEKLSLGSKQCTALSPPRLCTAIPCPGPSPVPLPSLEKSPATAGSTNTVFYLQSQSPALAIHTCHRCCHQRAFGSCQAQTSQRQENANRNEGLTLEPCSLLDNHLKKFPPLQGLFCISPTQHS